MPIYEYECKACRARAELMQKMSDPPPLACPSCGGGPIVKLISRTNFALKGQGWYVTDFRDGKKKPVEKSEGEGGEKVEPATKPEAVPAAEAKPESPSPTAAAATVKTAEPKPAKALTSQDKS